MDPQAKSSQVDRSSGGDHRPATPNRHFPPLFTASTECIVWGMQQRAVQGMLDFDYVCSRKKPSVVAMIYPFTYVFACLLL